jgi:hypothetical protein
MTDKIILKKLKTFLVQKPSPILSTRKKGEKTNKNSFDTSYGEKT